MSVDYYCYYYYGAEGTNFHGKEVDALLCLRDPYVRLL
jgi:hypothetical protein